MYACRMHLSWGAWNALASFPGMHPTNLMSCKYFNLLAMNWGVFMVGIVRIQNHYCLRFAVTAKYNIYWGVHISIMLNSTHQHRGIEQVSLWSHCVCIICMYTNKLKQTQVHILLSFTTNEYAHMFPKYPREWIQPQVIAFYSVCYC